MQPSQRYRQLAELFRNAGPDARAVFVEVSAASTGDLARPIVGRGAAFADVDGDLDVVLTQPGGGNRDAIGARVDLTARERTCRLWFMPARSYVSQVEPIAGR